jgi:hypothetical protein
MFPLASITPSLQEKLGHVAATVGKIGGTVAATCFVALLIKWCVLNRGFPLSKINDNGPVQVQTVHFSLFFRLQLFYAGHLGLRLIAVHLHPVGVERSPHANDAGSMQTRTAYAAPQQLFMVGDTSCIAA